MLFISGLSDTVEPELKVIQLKCTCCALDVNVHLMLLCACFCALDVV